MTDEETTQRTAKEERYERHKATPGQHAEVHPCHCRNRQSRDHASRGDRRNASEHLFSRPIPAQFNSHIDHWLYNVVYPIRHYALEERPR